MCNPLYTREPYHTPVFHVRDVNCSSVSTSTNKYKSLSDAAHRSLNGLRAHYRGAIAHGTPLSDDDQCALHVLQGPGTGDRSYLLGGTGRPVIRTTGTGADRCSVAGTGGGGRILENPRRCVSPPSDATAVTVPVCPVFRVVVAGRYLVCRFN